MIDLPHSWQIILLAIVQGITEFLPISSSGHLVVLGALFTGVSSSIELIVALHFGTLISIILFYFRRIIDLLTHSRRLILMLIVATVPTAIIGLLLRAYFKETIEHPLLAGFMLPVTGVLLLLMTRFRQGSQDYRDITLWQATAVGLAQAFALLPGISRSGSTIVAGSLVGLQRQHAATFSFLMAIPAIAGATILEARHLLTRRVIEHSDIADAGEILDQPVDVAWEWLGIGTVISFVVGLIALKLLSILIDRGQLHWFAAWVIPMGIFTIIWQLMVVSGN